LPSDSRSTAVHHLVKPAFSWFVEKDVAPDLVEARSLLASADAR